MSINNYILLSKKCNTTNIWAETGPGLFLDVLKNLRQEITPQILILTPEKYDHNFRSGSSSNFLGDSSQHWSKRQEFGESLFID